MTTQYQKYQRQSVCSQTPGEQLILLLEKICVSVAQGIRCIEAGDMPGAHNAITKAENIYGYLIDTLDLRFPLSKDLLSLYSFMLDRLFQANIKKDPSILKEIEPLTHALLETWKSAEQQSRKGGAV